MIKRPFWDEFGNYINDGEPVYLSGKISGGTPKFHTGRGRTDLLARCHDSESPISTMLRDKVMYRQMKERNASDKSFKKDAELLQSIANKKRKSEEKARIWKPANESLTRYRKIYKQDPL